MPPKADKKEKKGRTRKKKENIEPNVVPPEQGEVNDADGSEDPNILKRRRAREKRAHLFFLSPS